MYTQIRKLETRKVTAKNYVTNHFIFQPQTQKCCSKCSKTLFVLTCHGCNCTSNMQSLHSTTHTHTYIRTITVRVCVCNDGNTD